MSADRKLTRPIDGVIILLLLVISALIGWSFLGRGDDERIAKIIHDSQTVKEINLSAHHGRDIIEIMSDEKVTILVEDGAIGFIEHRCPDGLCEKTGMIQSPMQTAICLPLKVSIVIERKSGKADYDAIAG